MAEKLSKKLKVMAELRAGFTIEALSKKHGLHRKTIAGWKKALMVESKDLTPAVMTAIEQKTVDMLSDLGMPKKEALKILIEGMTEPMITQFEGKGEDMIATPTKDYKVILGYLRDYLKLIDAYPAEKSEISVKAVVVTVTEKLLALIAKYCPDDRRAEMAKEAEEVFKEVQG
jgi:transposase-like protein